MRNRFMLWPLLAAVFALTACGGGHSGPQAARPVITTVAKLAPAPAQPAVSGGLPALPADQRLNPMRMTAAADATQSGDQYDQASAGMTVNGGAAQLNSASNKVSWALYLFGGTPGEEITTCSYEVSGLDAGETVYCAISDYTANRWAFLPLATGASASFTLPDPLAGHYQSPLGNTWLLVATFGGDQVDLEHVSVTYTNRHNVSGQIVDKNGSGIAGVKVSTNFAGLNTLTDINGNYTLTGVPDGTWPVMATLDGWAFYSQPTFVTLSGADATADQIVGDPHGSRFAHQDLLPGNNNWRTAPFFDLEAGPLEETLSGDDDVLDAYRFTVSTPGNYIVRFSNPAHDILSPYCAVLDPNADLIASSSSVYAGSVGVALTVDNAPADFIFIALSESGGGDYTVTLLPQPACTLAAGFANGPFSVGGGAVDVTYTATGEDTVYFTDAEVTASSNYLVYDSALPAGDISLSGSLPGYTVNGPFTATLTPGTVQVVSLTYTGPMGSDSFEPNDTSGTAHAVVLPYNSGATPLQVSGTSGGDTEDWFTFTPQIGQAVLAYISSPSPFANQSTLYCTLYDHSLNNVGISSESGDGTLLLSKIVGDGNPFYLDIETSGEERQVVNYGVSLTAYTGSKVQVGARAGTPPAALDYVRFVLYSANFHKLFTLFSDDTGLTPPVWLPPGDDLRIDCYRYGMPVDGMTRLYSVPATDDVVYFDGPDEGSDSLEPNGSLSSPVPVQTLPATINATLSALDDPFDVYPVDPGDGRPFKVSLTTPGTTRCYVGMYDSTNTIVASRVLSGPADVVYLPNDGNPGQHVAVEIADLLSTPYTVQIANADAYHISGLVQNTTLTGLDGEVTVDSTGDKTDSNGFGGGDFHFPLLYPPGDYTIDAFAAGFDPGSNQQHVTITNADVAVNFTNFTASSHDNYEPNDTAGTAHSISVNTTYSASVDQVGTTDLKDYYSVGLTAGHSYRFEIDTDEPWETTHLTVFDPVVSNQAPGWPESLGKLVVDVTPPQSNPYVFEVTGTAYYTFKVTQTN